MSLSLNIYNQSLVILSEAKNLHWMLTLPVKSVFLANLLFSAQKASLGRSAADFRIIPKENFLTQADRSARLASQ